MYGSQPKRLVHLGRGHLRFMGSPSLMVSWVRSPLHHFFFFFWREGAHLRGCDVSFLLSQLALGFLFRCPAEGSDVGCTVSLQFPPGFSS